jgi:peptidoglycan/LPS O-acetylase OafA/YrhL
MSSDPISNRTLATAYGVLVLLAAGMLLWSLSRHSYDYFTFLRVVVCAASAFGAFLAFRRESPLWGFGLTALALLFNPFFTVGLKRQTWERVDVGAAVVLIASAVFAYIAAHREGRQ